MTLLAHQYSSEILSGLCPSASEQRLDAFIEVMCKEVKVNPGNNIINIAIIFSNGL